MLFIRRWLPFTLVTIGFLILVRVVFYSLVQLVTIYSLKPLEYKFNVSPDNYDGIDILSVLLYKMWLCSPEKVDFGTAFLSEVVEVFVGVSYGLSLGALGFFTWALSTRVQIHLGRAGTGYTVFWNGKLARWIMFITMVTAILLQLTLWATLPVHHYILPTLNDSISAFENSPIREFQAEGVKNSFLLNIVLLLFPALPVLGFIVFFIRKWKEHEQDDIKEKFETWEYQAGWMGTSFSYQDETQYPDIVIGKNVKTNEFVVQDGEDRNLNNLIVGSIGTGKTAARILPELNQDMNYMCHMINKFEEETDKDREFRLNGLVVIEPSNDLCKKAYQLAKAHNIPEEAIYYLDPKNKDTQSINPLRGPIEKAVETFTQIIQGLAANSNEFFKQSQRSHLKHYVYLLKLAKKNEATFDDLMELYNDTRLVADLLIEVEKTIPKDWTAIEDRDERNHWHIVNGICAWFRERGLLFMEDRNRMKIMYPTGHKHAGKQMVVDKQAEYVQGLRNILDDIAASKLIRRVLFGNSDFDIDTHLKCGGILLVNTAKGDLMQLSNVLGKFTLLLVTNGIFRRDPESKDPFHHVVVDEFPDYIYEDFKETPAQSRKYKTIITTASQSLAQLSATFGDDYMYTLVSTFRHKMVYADVDPKTAKIFAEFFGEDDEYETTHTENVTSSLMSAPRRADSVAVKKTLKQKITPSQIINLKPFYGALKLAKKEFCIVKANFVKKSEFKRAKIRVNSQKAQAWLEYRQTLMREMENQLLRDMGILKEGESNKIDAIPSTEIGRIKALYPGLPIYIDDKDREVINQLQASQEKKPSTSSFIINLDAYEPRQPAEKRQTVEKTQVQKDVHREEQTNSIPAVATIPKESHEISQPSKNGQIEELAATSDVLDPFSAIYSQVGTQERGNQKEPDKDLTHTNKPTSFLMELIAEPNIRDNQDIIQEPTKDIGRIIKEGIVSIDEAQPQENRSKKNNVLTEIELFEELRKGSGK